MALLKFHIASGIMGTPEYSLPCFGNSGLDGVYPCYEMYITNTGTFIQVIDTDYGIIAHRMYSTTNPNYVEYDFSGWTYGVTYGEVLPPDSGELNRNVNPWFSVGEIDSLPIKGDTVNPWYGDKLTGNEYWIDYSSNQIPRVCDTPPPDFGKWNASGSVISHWNDNLPYIASRLHQLSTSTASLRQMIDEANGHCSVIDTALQNKLEREARLADFRLTQDPTMLLKQHILADRNLTLPTPELGFPSISEPDIVIPYTVAESSGYYLELWIRENNSWELFTTRSPEEIYLGDFTYVPKDEGTFNFVLRNVNSGATQYSSFSSMKSITVSY